MRPGFDPWVGKIPWRREELPTLVFLPGELHGQRSLAGYSLYMTINQIFSIQKNEVLSIKLDNSMQCNRKAAKSQPHAIIIFFPKPEICGSWESKDLGWACSEEAGFAPHASHLPGSSKCSYVGSYDYHERGASEQTLTSTFQAHVQSHGGDIQLPNVTHNFKLNVHDQVNMPLPWMWANGVTISKQ